MEKEKDFDRHYLMNASEVPEEMTKEDIEKMAEKFKPVKKALETGKVRIVTNDDTYELGKQYYRKSKFSQ